MVNSLVSTNGKSVSHRIAAEGTLQRRRKGRRGTAFRCPLRSKDSNCEYLVGFFKRLEPIFFLNLAIQHWQPRTTTTTTGKKSKNSLEELAQWQGLHQLHPPQRWFPSHAARMRWLQPPTTNQPSLTVACQLFLAKLRDWGLPGWKREPLKRDHLVIPNMLTTRGYLLH